MNKVYIVKEIQYDLVRILGVYSDESKALAVCDEMLKTSRKIGVVNYIVEAQIVIH